MPLQQNIAVNGDKNKRQITSVRLTEDFRKRGWNFRKKMGWGDTGWVECPYEFKNLSSACLKLPCKPSYTIFFFFHEETNFKEKTKAFGFVLGIFWRRLFIIFFVEHLSCCFYHSLQKQNCKAIFHLFSYGYLGDNLLDWKIPSLYSANDRLLRAKKANKPKLCSTFGEYTFVLCKCVLFESNLIYIEPSTDFRVILGLERSLGHNFFCPRLQEKTCCFPVF